MRDLHTHTHTHTHNVTLSPLLPGIHKVRDVKKIYMLGARLVCYFYAIDIYLDFAKTLQQTYIYIYIYIKVLLHHERSVSYLGER